MRRFSLHILSLLAVCLPLCPLRGGVIQIPTSNRNIWRLARAELDGNPATLEVAGSTYDGRVCGFTLTGTHLWDGDTGGFVFDVAAGDLDGDGRDEIVAACANGKLYVFGPDGQLRWQHDFRGCVIAVAIARVGGVPCVAAGGATRTLTLLSANGDILKTKDVARYIAFLHAGNFDEDPEDEILVESLTTSPDWSPYYLDIYDTIQLVNIWSQGRNDQLIDTYYRGFHCDTPDIDNSGTHELLTLEGVYRLQNPQRVLIPFKLPQFPAVNFDYHYRMPLVAGGDLTSDSWMEFVTAHGAEIALYGFDGSVLGNVRIGQGFSDMIYLPGEPHGSILFGSMPNGDDNLYRVTFEDGWEQTLEHLPRTGHIGAITQSLNTMLQATEQWDGQPLAGQSSPYVIGIDGWQIDGPDKFNVINYMDTRVSMYRDHFPYPNLLITTRVSISENKQILRPDGQPWGRDSRQRHLMSQADIVYVGQQLESRKIPFIAIIGHGDDPFMDIDTVELLLNAAPTMCLGFNIAETEGVANAPYYIEHFVQQVLELCVQHGNKMFIMDEKNTWWASMAAIPAIRNILFNPRYRNVLVPSVEDSNSRTPDLNLAARVGLWLNGSVNRWGCRMASDWFSFARAWEWEYPMTGHPHLRYFFSHAALGATVFTIQIGSVDRTGQFSRIHNEAVAPFLHMLGKGITTPPTREQLQSIAPVVIRIENPTARFHDTGHNGHSLSNFNESDLNEHVFSRMDCYWGMAPTPDWDPAAYLWGRKRQYGNHVPSTPYGLVAVLADSLRDAGAALWTSQWQTDGDFFYHDQQQLSAAAARVKLESEASAAPERYPIRISGAGLFYQLVKADTNRYIVYLADAGWVDPADRTVQIDPQPDGPWYVLNRLTGDILGTLDTRLTLTIPAGMPMILEITTDLPTGISDSGDALPYTFQLRRLYPNPFNAGISLEFSLPKSADTILDIYNILGQQVRRLVNKPMNTGMHTVQWNGCNETGQTCATGIYIVRLQSAGQSATQKILLLR